MAGSNRSSVGMAMPLSPDRLSKSIEVFGMQVKGRPNLNCPERFHSRGVRPASRIGMAATSIIQTESLAVTEDRHPILPVNGHPAFAVYLPVVLVAKGQGAGFFIYSQ